MEITNGYITYLNKKYDEMDPLEKIEFHKHLKKIKTALNETAIKN